MDLVKRRKVLECLGNFSPKCDLNISVELIEDKGTYYQKLISYDVENSERVESFLLVPKNISGKVSAIVAIHQHAGKWHLGKSEVVGISGEKDYHYGLDLVKRGYVVIVPDLLCFESRISDYFSEDKTAHSFYERFEFCKKIYEGSCLQTKYLHDLSRAVDVLCSLEYVDSESIGAIGHSLGGQETTWLMWYDKRIKFGVSSCGTGTMQSMFKENVLHNFALYVPGLRNVCDIDEIVSDIAPRAFFMSNGTEDKYFPISGVEKIINTASKTYKKLNCRNKFKSIIFQGGHSFSVDIKEQAYDWIDKQK
ncbi:MAG: prolyl oligopeptidase family serine peptidase [Clostridia bacterium]|nr:prolyl oligopeptidase family serine peptidase [Clostridia bacterium]